MTHLSDLPAVGRTCACGCPSLCLSICLCGGQSRQHLLKLTNKNSEQEQLLRLRASCLGAPVAAARGQNGRGPDAGVAAR
eukprot:378649-Rhodomonas_salina.1